MKYNAKREWDKTFSAQKEVAYPAEYVIRIFKGKYPHLDLTKNSFENKKICDIGFGDGRHLIFLGELGFDVHGIDISEDIVKRAQNNFSFINSNNIRVGSNDKITFDDDYFDYLLSWNSCYYMGEINDFNIYVKEFARVLKKRGKLVLSIPKKTCFIFKNSEKFSTGYRIIRDDPFNVRNGEILRVFEDENEIKAIFSKYFENFVFGSVQDACFGFNYHWHLVVCDRK